MVFNVSALVVGQTARNPVAGVLRKRQLSDEVRCIVGSSDFISLFGHLVVCY